MNRRGKMIAVAFSLLVGVVMLGQSNWAMRAQTGDRALVKWLSSRVVGETTPGSKANSIAAIPLAPTVTATKTDNLSTSANPGDTINYTVNVGASGMDATGVMFNDTLDANTTLVPGSVMTTPLALPDSYTASGNIRITIAAPGVLANDVDPDGIGPALAITAGTITSANGGNVTLNADGGFTYNPAPGFEGTDTFTYTLADGEGNTETGTVTFTVSGMIWFIDNSLVTNGDGRLSAPFNNLASFVSNAADDPGDNIFLYRQTATDYVGTVTLLNNQKLIGQGATASLSSITGITPPAGSDPLPATGGTRPSITSTANAVTLGSDNLIRGLNFGNRTNAAINGSSFGVLTVSDVDITGNGQALNLSTGTLATTFGSIASTNSSATGISLSGVGGSFMTGTTTITNPTGIGISVSSSSATLNFGNTTANQSGNTGVSLTTNTGTITFADLDIAPDASQRGLHATDNSNNITATSGAITTSGATAVEITRASSATPLVISLTSVSANGGTSGIVLTRTSGSFAIAGNTAGLCGGAVGTGPPTSAATATAPVAADCTGGTIQNTTGPGIVLNNTTNISLTRVRVTGSGDDGLQGTSVTGFTLASSLIEGNGNAVGEAGLDFGDVSDTTPDGLFGTASITNSTIRNSSQHNLSVRNQNGAVSLTVTGSQFTNISTNTSSGHGIVMDAVQTASMTSNIQGSYFAANRADHFQAAGSNSAVLNVTFKNNTLAGGHSTALGQGIRINAATSVALGSYSGRIDYDIDGNNIRGAISNAIITNLGTSSNAAVFDGFIRNNIIGTAGVALSGSSQANCIEIDAHGNGNHIVSVTGNTLKRCFDRGILVLADEGNGSANFTVTGNNVSDMLDINAITSTPREAFHIATGATATNVFGQVDSHAVCLTLTGNTFDSPPNFVAEDVRLRQRFRTSIRLPGYGGTAFDATAVQNFVAGNNSGPPAAIVVATATNDPAVTTDGYFGGTACSTPTAAMALDVDSARAETVDQLPSPARSVRDEQSTLHAAHGEAPQDDNVQKLPQQELTFIVQAALARWRETDIAPEDMARLEAATFEIADLPDGVIATGDSTRIRIDETAAGYGWFTDWSPSEDTEFEVPVPGRELQILESSLAFGRMDLLTVVMRQLGHVLGKEDRPIDTVEGWLMQGTLMPGVRRAPVLKAPETSNTAKTAGTALERVRTRTLVAPIRQALRRGRESSEGGNDGQTRQFAALQGIPFSNNGSALAEIASLEIPPGFDARPLNYAMMASPRAAASSIQGESIILSIGTLPAGKSITITFQATVSNPLPVGVCQISNQGTVSGTNFSSVLTDDTAVGGAADPTLTMIETPPTITGATISRQQGAAASSSQIATVNDCNQAENTLAVTVDGGASATVNGVTVSSISVDASGNVTASVEASCTATNASFTLTVTDNQTATATATLTVNVTPNTPPTLGNYPDTGPVNVGANTTVTPDAAPTDNGTIATLTAAAPGFAGTLSGNTTTGVITVTNASPGGIYTVTVTATDNCGATTTKTFQLSVNNLPTITGATISRQKGNPASTSQIAMVNDNDQAENTLAVTVDGGASATVNGVTVSGISVDAAGNVTASVVASCTATNATFTLSVSDSQAASATAMLTVNVTPNTPPTLGTYPNAGTSPGGSVMVTPNVPPGDNGTIATLTASAPGFAGTFSGNTTTGVITVTNVNPPGSYTVTVTATDNCGATSTTTFTLSTNTPPSITGATISRQQGAAASSSQIATVSDPNQAANTLVVTVNGGASATVNGVTVSGISVDAAGNVTASVVASCTATNATFNLTVTDSSLATGTGTLTVNVTASNAPVIMLKPSLAPWPPNHKYRTLTIADMVASATDDCNGNLLSSVVIEKVTSDEPDDAPGNNDGMTSNDIVINPNCKSVQLRSERDETKDGRVYSVTLRVSDSSGNPAYAVFKVRVPINQSGGPAVEGGVSFTVNSNCQ